MDFSGMTITGGVTIAPPSTPAGPTTIGEAYGGGYYAGKISTAGNGVADYYLIVAPKSTGESFVQWKTTDTATTGTSSLIDGPANTNAMNNANHPAAQFCKNLTIGGYTDWYMPAQNELEVCYFFLKPSTTSNFIYSGQNQNAVSPEPINTYYTADLPTQTTATLFQTGNTQVFPTTGHWSSTQNNDTSAWYQPFSNGIQSTPSKTSGYNVRAVRRIPI
jgi:hypothetical protein